MQCINVLSVETMTSPFYHITRRQILQETTIFYGKKNLGFLHFTKGEFGRTSGLCPVFNGKATSPTQLHWRPDKWPNYVCVRFIDVYGRYNELDNYSEWDL